MQQVLRYKWHHQNQEIHHLVHQPPLIPRYPQDQIQKLKPKYSSFQNTEGICDERVALEAEIMDYQWSEETFCQYSLP